MKMLFIFLISMFYIPTASGWYLYIESSAPRKLNDTARLLSASVPSGQTYCFKFWYHMYGANVNSLSVGYKVSKLSTLLV